MRMTPVRATTGSAARSSAGTSSARPPATLATDVLAAGFRPDVVIAIARGGLLLAGAISYALGTKACGSINVEFYSGIDERLPEPVLHPPMLDAPALSGKRVLLVDDVSDSGRTLAKVVGACSPTTAPRCAPRPSTRSRTPCSMPDFDFRRTDDWIVFPWSALPPVEVAEVVGVSVHLVGGGWPEPDGALCTTPFLAEATARRVAGRQVAPRLADHRRALRRREAHAEKLVAVPSVRAGEFESRRDRRRARRARPGDRVRRRRRRSSSAAALTPAYVARRRAASSASCAGRSRPGCPTSASRPGR